MFIGFLYGIDSSTILDTDSIMLKKIGDQCSSDFLWVYSDTINGDTRYWQYYCKIVQHQEIYLKNQITNVHQIFIWDTFWYNTWYWQ